MNFEKEKLSIRRLYIELGRMCNLTCEHCCAGEMENVSIDIDYVDRLLNDIEWIGDIVFTGGEPMLYVDKMDGILDLIINRGIPLKNINVTSNGTIKSNEFIDLTKKYFKYMKKPEEGILQFSDDKFHFSTKHGFTREIMLENMNWYKDRLSMKFQLGDNAQRTISRAGRAKNLSEKDMKDIPKIVIPNYEYGNDKIIQIDKSYYEDETHIKNYVKKSIYLSAKGLIQYRSGISYEDQKKYAMGNICEKGLIEIIENWNDHCLKANNNDEYINSEYIIEKNEAEEFMIGSATKLLTEWSKQVVLLAKVGNKKKILEIKEAAIRPLGNFRIQYNKGEFKKMPNEAKLINEQIDVFFNGIDISLSICDNPLLRLFV